MEICSPYCSSCNNVGIDQDVNACECVIKTLLFLEPSVTKSEVFI